MPPRVSFIVPMKVQQAIGLGDEDYEVYGGWEHSYCRALMAKGCEAKLYVFSKWTDRRRRLKHKYGHEIVKCRSRYIPRWRGIPLGGLQPSADLLASILDDRADIYHIHSCLLPSYDYIAPWLRVLKKPFVGGVFEVSRIGRLEQILSRFTLNLADRLQVVSRNEITKLVTRFKVPPHRIAYLPNSVDTESLHPIPKGEAREAVGLDPDLKYVLYLGRLEWKKGVQVLLEAFAVVAKRIRDARLLIVGSGDAAAKLRRLATQTNCSEAIKFCGFVPEAEKIYWYNAADVFTLPSIRGVSEEAFGVTLLESMSCGIPVVASNIGGIPGFVANGLHGILVPPQNSESLAQALISLLESDGLRGRMSIRARAHVSENFSIDKLGERLLNLYSTILYERRLGTRGAQ